MIETELISRFQRIDTDIYSVLENYTGASYDRKAKMYEKLVSNKLYNKIIWGTSPGDYKEFAENAINSSTGKLLDVGCGGLIQTAEFYKETKASCYLVDNSSEMLKIAKSRLINPGEELLKNIKLVQADAFDLPFPDKTFDTACSFGMIHLFDKKNDFIDAILSKLKVGGFFYFSSMITKRAISKLYMRQLQKINEFGQLYSEKETLALFENKNLSLNAYVKGSMLFIEGQKN